MTLRMEKERRKRGRRVKSPKKRNWMRACWTGGPNTSPPLRP